MVKSNQYFVKDCIDKISLRATINKEVAVWRMKKIIDDIYIGKQKKFDQFCKVFSENIVKAEIRENIRRKNFFLFSLNVIKEKKWVT